MNFRTLGTAFLLWALITPLHAESEAAQKSVLAKVGFTQNLNGQIPMDLNFRDSTGKSVHLSHYFTDKPVILTMVYFECPMLCTETLNGLIRTIRSISFSAGKDYTIVTVSFDPKETSTLAAAKRRVYVDRYGRKTEPDGWAFLTGDESAIHRLTDTAGFHYTYDSELQQFAHGTGIVILTPSGKISHYMYGVEYSASELKLALLDASAGKIGSPADQLLLYCYHYDPLSGRYNLQIVHVLQLAGLLTVVILAGAIGFMVRREKLRAAS